MNWEKILSFQIWGNDGQSCLNALGVFISISLAFYVFQKIIIAKIKKTVDETETDLDDFVLSVVRNVKPPFYLFVAFYIGIQALALEPIVNKFIYGVFLAAIVIQIVLIIQKVIDYFLRKKLEISSNDKNRGAMIKLIGQIVKWSLWLIGLLLILSNLGVNITSLIAGMGIGGIAIALAAQNVLGDIFASFSIYIDKPFEIGDFIKVNKDMGTVVKIGIKTTRIKTLKGNEMSIPNKKLTDAELHNFSRMEGRRKIFAFGVTYETPIEKLRGIKKIITEIFDSMGGKVKLERIHFKGFGDSSLNFEMSFWTKEARYTKFMDIIEEINFKILEKFNTEGIDFAYPTQMVHLARMEKKDSKI